MNTIITKIIHSQSIKDTISVTRGLYKIVQGKYQVKQQQKSISSWHHLNQEPLTNFKTQQQTIKSKQENIQNQSQQKLKNNQNITFNDNISNHFQNRKKNTQQIKIKHFYTSQDLIKAGQENIRQQNLSKRSFQQSSVPASRIHRFFQFGKIGKNLAQSMVGSYFKEKTTGQKDLQGMEKRATILSQSLCKMRGAPLKLAQMLSIQQNNLISTPVRKAFQKARQTSHIVSLQEVQYMMKNNLGQNWRQKFTQFQNKPFASASIGQVHKATIGNKKVAVKIQYPGVAQSVNSDLDNLALLVKYTGVFPKGAFIDKIIQSARQQLMQQCDYQLEKKFHKLYNDCLQKVYGKSATDYRVPNCFDQYCTKQILTSEYLSGVSMSQLQDNDYSQDLRDQIGRRIMNLTFTQFFEMGIMQTDPNPSNFTYNLKKEELNLLDYGATHIYKKQWLEEYYRLVEGSVKKDEKKIWQCSINTGFVTGEQNSLMKNAHIESILLVGQALRYKGYYDFGSQQITKRIYETIPIMLKNRLKQPPKQVYSLHRKLSGAYLACIRLKARVDCSKIWQKIKFRNVISEQLN